MKVWLAVRRARALPTVLCSGRDLFSGGGEVLKEPLSLGCDSNFRIITELRYWKLTSWVKQAGGGVR